MTACSMAVEECDDGNTDVGDGCSGLCHTEPFFECKMPGKPCTTTIVCGDSKVIGPEACDDGNTVGSDGCSADCSQVEPGFTCPKTAGVGGTCIAVPTAKCGDSIIQYGEFCDDGNTDDADGCSHLCKVESGYTCPKAGMVCQRIGVCGDGALTSDEECDDHNVLGNDGCSPQCTVEPNFICPQPNTPCVTTVKCGDKKITGNETCDDGNTAPGDGCSTTCQVETGWICPAGTFCRAAMCGDGYKAGAEQCDDHNITSGDGCSSTCTLEGAPNGQKDGWQCLTPGSPCTRTNCGNSIVEGSEQCDNPTKMPFGGCSWNCQKEPSCGYDTQAVPQYGCSKVCGDGMVFPGEACDDGNIKDADGCQSDCTVTPGWDCSPVRPTLPAPLYMPIMYRDFSDQNPQFEVDPRADRGLPGIPQTMLDAQGKPQYNLGYTSPANANAAYSLKPGWTLNGAKPADAAPVYTMPSQIAPLYANWYRTVANVNVAIQSTLPIPLVGTSYVYDSTAFFPIDGLGFGNQGRAHNYHFTSEIRYWFEYQGGESLAFRGDDDVWVFLNGRLAVDLGGIHNPLNGSVSLDSVNNQVTMCQEALPFTGATCSTVASWLTKGNIYEICVFQAERHVTGSNYKLTLNGFNSPKSVCTPHCGDGMVVGNEACDLGTAKNTGAYGTCNADCTLTPRCGDAVKNGPEQCDDGLNVTTYNKAKKCGPGCVFAPYCGDGIISNGEVCDDGVEQRRRLQQVPARLHARCALWRRLRQRWRSVRRRQQQRDDQQPVSRRLQVQVRRRVGRSRRAVRQRRRQQQHALRRVQARLYARPALRRRFQERHRGVRRRQERR